MKRWRKRRMKKGETARGVRAGGGEEEAGRRVEK